MSGRPARGDDPRWALFRLALGIGQMSAAIGAMILFLEQGTSRAALEMTAVACGLTLTSRLLFARPPRRR